MNETLVLNMDLGVSAAVASGTDAVQTIPLLNSVQTALLLKWLEWGAIGLTLFDLRII